MNKTLKKTLLIGLPAIAGGIIILLANKNKKPVKNDAPPDAIKKVPPPLTAKVTTGFPLKKGSTGDLVKTLQRIIGTTPDGIFGPNTEAALVAYANIRTVDNQTQLDTLQKKATGISTAAKAKTLLDKFNANSNLSIYVTKSVTCPKITIDYAGAIIPTGEYLEFPGPYSYDRNYYTLISYSKAEGNLLLKADGTDDNDGIYLIDTGHVTLV